MIIKEIPISQISIRDNIRQYTLGKENLMQSIKDYGLLQPIGVKETAVNEYYLIWGSRRLDACKKLGHKTISAVIFSDKDQDLDEETFLILNAIENQHQNPNTLIELGRVCRILRKTLSVSEIASRMAIPKRRVEIALNEIQRIPKQFQHRIKVFTSTEDKKGDIPLNTAYGITRLRGLSEEQKVALFEYASKNDTSKANITAIGSLMKTGKTLEEAEKVMDKYMSVATKGFYVDRHKYNEILEKGSFSDFVIDCINAKIPNFAIKKILSSVM